MSLSVVVWSCGTDVELVIGVSPNSTVIPLCPYRTAISGLPLLLSIFTVLGNLLVLFVILSDAKLRKKETNILIFNLSLADLMVGSMVTPLALVTTATNGRWLFSPILCRVWISLDVICCTASIATLCAISIERLIGVVRPMHYKHIVTAKRIIIACSLIWLFSLSVLLATIRWVSFVDEGQTNETEIERSSSPLGLAYPMCNVGVELKYVIHSIILSFFIPLAVILVVYFKIYRVVSKRETSLVSSILFRANPHALAVKPLSPRHRAVTHKSLRESDHITVLDDDINMHDRLAKPRMSMFPLRMHYGGKSTAIEKQQKFFSKQKKSAKMLSKVVGAFFICWFPFFLLYMIHHLCNCIPGPVLELFTWFGYMNSGLNPIIYAMTIRGIGSKMKEKLDRVKRQWCRVQCCGQSSGCSESEKAKLESDDRDSHNSLEASFGLHLVRNVGSSMRLPKRLRSFAERRRHQTLRSKRSGGSNADFGYWSQEGSRYSNLHRVVEEHSLNTQTCVTSQMPKTSSWMTLKLYTTLISTQSTPV